MVRLQYKGKNYLRFGMVKIASGVTEVSDSDFLELLRYKTFKNRVEQGIIKLPQGLSLDQFTTLKQSKEVLKQEELKNNPVATAEDKKEEESEEKPSDDKQDKNSKKK